MHGKEAAASRQRPPQWSGTFGTGGAVCAASGVHNSSCGVVSDGKRRCVYILMWVLLFFVDVATLESLEILHYRVDTFQARAALTNRNSRVSKNY